MGGCEDGPGVGCGWRAVFVHRFCFSRRSRNRLHRGPRGRWPLSVGRAGPRMSRDLGGGTYVARQVARGGGVRALLASIAGL